MAVRLSVRDVYSRGEPVTFFAALEPTDPPLELPNSEPYSIARAGDLIYQPGTDPARVVLHPSAPMRWSWDQHDLSGREVTEGNYRLHFFYPGHRLDEDFTITRNRQAVVKSSAKWLKRACMVGGPFIGAINPWVGAVITVLAFPLQRLEHDPPDPDYVDVARVQDFDLPLETATRGGIVVPVGELIRLGLTIEAVRTTIEREDAAREAEAHMYAGIQERHLIDLVEVTARLLERSSEMFGTIIEQEPDLDQTIESSTAMEQLRAGLAAQELQGPLSLLLDADVSLSDVERIVGQQLPSLGNLRSCVVQQSFELHRFGTSLQASMPQFA